MTQLASPADEQTLVDWANDELLKRNETLIEALKDIRSLCDDPELEGTMDLGVMVHRIADGVLWPG